MALATLTKTGRAAIAAAITNEKLYLAWGSGNEAWDAPDAVLPSLIDATGLVAEVGRRIVSSVGFVTPDDSGGIVIPVSQGANGEVQEARYSPSATPTPYLYVLTNFDFADAANAVIREMGIFMGGSPVEGLPPGQRYFLPAEIANPGLLMAAQIILPSINRSPSVRQSVEFVLPI
ncbi:MAG TPA: hypothetical protein VEZ52_09930 [Desulfovibrio sp.]|uniref:hypothetical protein n=1 Tax=Desulfovibrio sp. TaxID=885 RepID=UPI002D2AD3B0|nr:hypothetical protein [Desulfovibrio sp.]HZF61925.1 hypothetical protein [Desulfovibrio sp.]